MTVSAIDTLGVSELEMLRAQLAAAQAKIDSLKAAGQRKLTCKVSEKGALCVYGLGRFPVTLYRGQWERLIEHVPVIREFIADHADQLSVKE